MVMRGREHVAHEDVLSYKVTTRICHYTQVYDHKMFDDSPRIGHQDNKIMHQNQGHSHQRVISNVSFNGRKNISSDHEYQLLYKFRHHIHADLHVTQVYINIASALDAVLINT